MRTEPARPALEDPLVRALLTLLVIIAALWLVQMLWTLIVQFQDLILLFVLAWIISFLLEPGVAGLTRWLPRAAAVLSVYLALLLIVGVGAVLLVPGLVVQSQALEDRLPELAARFAAWGAGWTGFFADRGISVGDYTSQLLAPIQSVGPWLVANALTLATQMASILFQMVIVIVLSIYLMLDGDRFGGRILQAVPTRYRHDFAYFVGSIYRAFGGFLRGQIIQSLVYGVGIAVVMLVAGLPFATLVSVLAGLSIFIPFLGPLLGIIPPVGIALAVDASKVWVVLGASVALNLVVMNFVAPKVMSQQIGLNPIVVLGSVLVGARLGGPWGALFGVPVAAVIGAMLAFYQLTVADREQRVKEVVGSGEPVISQPAQTAPVTPRSSTGAP